MPLEDLTARLARLPRATLAVLPTPVEEMPNLARALGGPRIYVKRDDLTGLAFGGNKARQLEFHFGEALAKGADTVLITGSVQSNYARGCAAAAAKLGLVCHVQLEDRVSNESATYKNSGNVLLDRLLGATIHRFPEGENEAAADANLDRIAAELAATGSRPYVIHLGPAHPPLGGFGYIIAAQEILAQAATAGLRVDAVVVGSGSAATHGGLLFGLRALGSRIPVIGVCVRRAAELQKERVTIVTDALAERLDVPPIVGVDDVALTDATLAPGYGRPNPAVLEAMALAARTEALILDPVYTGKAMAGLMYLIRQRTFGVDANVIFVHTGGQPGLFAYEPELTEAFAADRVDG